MPPPLEKLTPQSDMANASTTTENQSKNKNVSAETISSSGHTEKSTLKNENEPERFQSALKRVVLSSSPFCKYSVPYLLTDDGKQCPTRPFIANQIYNSDYFTDQTTKDKQVAKYLDDEEESAHVSSSNDSNVILKPLHSFTDPSVLINCIDNKDSVKTLLNDFRAQGGQVRKS